VREFAADPLTDDELSQLLWAAQGVTDPARGRRAAPSAGATYPLNTCVATASGLFRYVPAQHTLEDLSGDDIRSRLAESALGQGWIRRAPAVFIFSATAPRTTGRYGERGEMYIHMEAGHAAQNLHLQAVALGLGSAPVAAFVDAEVERLVGCAPGERVLYLIPVGRAAA
jgi:SagB-type dehydrogenase family enzyme